MGYERLHGSKASAPEPCRCVSLGKVHPPDLRSIHPALTAGREVAHLALDDARIMPAAAALGGHRDDLDQDDLSHAPTLARGKKRRGREDDAGRPARHG